MATPHISAEPGQIAPRVLMPGDPYRAARIAKDFLSDVQVVSDVRGIQCHSGTWNGHEVAVMASGMGVPTIQLYATELFRFYDVQRIIRVGTCGALNDDVNIRDVVIATAAHTNNSIPQFAMPGGSLSLAASYPLLRAAGDAAEHSDATVHMGAVFSSDFFYLHRDDTDRALAEVGTLGVEMETAGLYYAAMRERREALTILTVSDHLTKPSEDMTSAERETGYRAMVELALEAICSK